MVKNIITLLAIILSMIVMVTHAQPVLQRESFEGTIFPAPGWKQIKVSSNINAVFSRQGFATSTNPAVGASPGGGTQIMMLNSFNSGTSTIGDTAVMVTKPFDFSNNGGNQPSFRFYMYRDNGWSGNDDHIRVYINTSPSLVGGTLLTNTAGVTKLSRLNTAFPSVVANTWNQYTYNLDPSIYNQKRYYFIIVGVAQGGNNLYLDQIETNTYPSPTLPGDASLNIFIQNTATGGIGQTNHMIVGVRCIIGGNSGCGVVNGVSSTALKLDSLLFNTNGTTNVNDIQNARVWYTGGSNLFSTGYVSPFPATAGADKYPTTQYGQTIVTPSTNLDFSNQATSCFYLEYDTTYFWLTYDIRPTATGGNSLDGDFRGGAVGGPPGTCPSPTGSGISVIPSAGGFSIPGSTQIDLPYCTPTYTVGTAFQNYTNNDYINSVQLVGIPPTIINTTIGARNNNTGLPTSLGCYPNCNFTAQPPSYELWPPVPGRTVILQQGQPYTLTVQAGTWFSSNNIKAWIDYNRDGDFNDPGETLGGVSLAALSFGNIPFVVPAAGFTGQTRLRVREVWLEPVSTIDPCAQYTYGETEDFIITISPNCPANYKLWLGNNNNWFDPANWCGGVPTITDSAVVNRSQVTGLNARPYFKPIIKSNPTQANCNFLFISNQDTLVIDAPNPSTIALKVRTTLTNNGRIETISGFNTAISYSNGVLQNNIYTPFKATATDARSQIIYSATELSSQGILAGDRITEIQFSLWLKSSSVPYNGFTVSYALVPFDEHTNTTPYAGPFITVFGPQGYPTSLGLNSIVLTNPIVWDGTSNILIQYCFDNAGNIGINDDRIYITQTTGKKSTLILSTNTNANTGCSLTPGAGVSDNFFSALNTSRPNFTFIIDRIYKKPIINVQKDWINNGTFQAGKSLVLMDSTLNQTIGGTQSTTFHELEVNKTALSVRLLRNTSVEDTLTLTSGLLELNGNSLTILNSAPSSGVHTTFNNIGGPITRTNGFIISESSNLLPNISYVKWVIGSNIGWRVIPFGHSTINPIIIPFTFSHLSGDLGTFSVATYSTLSDNLPYPPTVTHLRNYNNSVLPDNSANVVDRFWMTEKTGLNPLTTIVFRWADIENSIGMSSFNSPRAQPWRYVAPDYEAWLRISGTAGAGGIPIGSTLGTSTPYSQNSYIIAGQADSCRVTNWNWPVVPGPPSGPIGDYLPWALSNNNQPLPIELADFNAYRVGNKVKITWVTISEVNNSHFVIERFDENLSNFKEVDIVYSYFGNSNQILSYNTWDNNPIIGLQFYRLRQVDYNGSENYSDYRSVNFNSNPNIDIVNVFNNENDLLNLEIITNTTSPIKIKVMDVSGKIVFTKENVPTILGSNKFLIDCNISNGLYFMIVENDFELKSKRFLK